MNSNNLNNPISNKEVRKHKNNILKLLKEKTENPEFYSQPNISFNNEGKISTFSVYKQTREFIANKPELQEMQKQVI